MALSAAAIEMHKAFDQRREGCCLKRERRTRYVEELSQQRRKSQHQQRQHNAARHQHSMRRRDEARLVAVVGLHDQPVGAEIGQRLDQLQDQGDGRGYTKITFRQRVPDQRVACKRQRLGRRVAAKQQGALTGKVTGKLTGKRRGHRFSGARHCC